jgi:hypothetical protein
MIHQTHHTGTEVTVVAIIMSALMVTGCETREIAETESAEAKSSASSKSVVFQDSFERDTLGDTWERGRGEGGSGDWQIKDGWLYGQNIKNDPLWLQQRLPQDVRIEFKAKAESKEGDIKVEVFGDGSRHESGYILIFGGWSNQLDVIARLDEHGDDRKEQPSEGVEPGRVYQMAVERTGSTITWFVGGEPFMTYDDDSPLTGKGHRFFAFNNWTAPVRFDDIRVIHLEE